jgi:bifunctional UDP-N-acetylglucosamine pyrophosphorylase/glucosamine-1-phosphate N-acetyltransferase
MPPVSAIPTAAIILAAGKGTRMQSALPKVMHEVAQLPMVGHVIKTAQAAGLGPITLVVSPEMATVTVFAQTLADDVREVHQTEQLGTGHAVLCAKKSLETFDGNLMILYGDTPLITAETITKLQECLLADARTAVAVLGFTPPDAGSYGRLIMNAERTLERIVEAKDANASELKVTLCNSGVIALRGNIAWEMLERIENNNAKGEYYLTDVVAIARAAGYTARVVEADADEVLGVNSRVELAQAEAIFQARKRHEIMLSGVTLQSPDTVYFSHDTSIAPDTLVEPNVVFGEGVAVGSRAHIKAFCHIEGSVIGDDTIVGPFARLRPGTNLGAKVRIGNFVEIKKSEIEDGAKVNHLSYIGDATVGENANIGAGTITCNYDGYHKYRTVIGREVFIGSNTALVAPLTVGDGAMVAAGSVITEDIAPDALALARTRQEQKEDWARSFRENQKNKKAGTD